MSAGNVARAAGLVLGLCAQAAAQSYSSCPDFRTEGIHEKIDCIEALFSAAPAHLTFSSVPPSNGFALGGVLEQQTHYVSPANRLPDIDISDPSKRADTGYLSLTDALLGGAVSTNGSWYMTGSFSWLPPLHYTTVTEHGVNYQKLGPLKTHQVFGIQLYGTHRSIQNLSFFGEGSTAGATGYVFKQTETYAGATARLPLTAWLTAVGQAEYRQISLPADNASNSVQSNFTGATVPGLNGQPGFMHYTLAAETDATWRSEPASPPETLSQAPGASASALLKHRFIFRLQNRAGYDWYQDLNTALYSFRQFGFEGDESLHLGAVFLKYLPDKSHPATFAFLRFVCGGTGRKVKAKSAGAIGDSFKKDDVCDFGQFDVKSRVAVSQTGAGSVVPFYYQPTLGGSDIDSRVTLRGYPDYRFRGNDLALMQLEYSKPIPALDPIGIFAFYDGGTVSAPGQSLGMATFRQDGGLGASLRLQGKIVIQAYAAMGAGHGVHLGYNLEKLF
jgi:hypothetical protein